MTNRDPREQAPPRDVELSDLVVILAHDIKNALAALTANLHFLDSSMSANGDPESVEALSDSVTLCQVLDHFLRNLDLLGRYETVTAHKVPTSMRSLAHDATARFERQAKMAGVELHVEAAEGRDAFAFVDRDLFQRAIENVVSNAVENAPKGSRIQVVIEGGDHESSLTVIDSRLTPPPALLRTREADGQRTQDRQRGRGLGVLCADVAARAAGGRLERGGRPSECRLRLVAPSREQEASST